MQGVVRQREGWMQEKIPQARLEQLWRRRHWMALHGRGRHAPPKLFVEQAVLRECHGSYMEPTA
jgi:hypothetical protein